MPALVETLYDFPPAVEYRAVLQADAFLSYAAGQESSVLQNLPDLAL